MKTPINMISEDDITRFAESGSMSDYQNAATKSAVYPGRGTTLGLAYVALKLNGEAGELAEHVGKALRDDDLMVMLGTTAVDLTEELTEDRRGLIIKELGDILWYVSAAANELDMTLGDVARENLLKLHDRQNRGVLQGSGDDR